MFLFNNILTFSFHYDKVATHWCNFRIKNGCKNHYLYLVLENIYSATDAVHSIPFTAYIILRRNIF